MEQVANPNEILARFKLPFDPGVGADGVVVLLQHRPLGVGQGQYRVQRRTKAAGFDFDDERPVFLDLEFELVHVLFAADPAIDQNGRVHRVGVAARVVRFGFADLGQLAHVEQHRVRIASGCMGANFLLAERRVRLDSQFHVGQPFEIAPAQRNVHRFASLTAQRARRY